MGQQVLRDYGFCPMEYGFIGVSTKEPVDKALFVITSTEKRMAIPLLPMFF